MEYGVIGLGVVILLVIAPMNFRKILKPKGGHPSQETPPQIGLIRSGIGSDSPGQVSLAAMPALDEALVQRQQGILKEPWGRDPFVGSKARLARTGTSQLILRGISVPDKGKAMAILGEQIVQEGDQVEDYTVKQIEPGQVILERLGREFILRREEEESASESKP